jgi:hypothetical protein
MNHLRHYDLLSKPPVTALKEIQAGRLRGKTDINPQWRYRAMTERFGPIGVGWKFTIDDLWTVPAFGDQVFAFARVSVYYTEDGGDGWSQAIQGVGGSMLVEQEKSGLHANDEAYKMAVTDALSAAMKMIGVGAAIYSGQWDGKSGRYHDAPQEDPAPAKPAPAAKVQGRTWADFTPAERYADILARIVRVQGDAVRTKKLMDWVQDHDADFEPQQFGTLAATLAKALTDAESAGKQGT